MAEAKAAAKTRALGSQDTIKDIRIDVKRCPDCGARFGIEAAFCPFDGSPLTTSTWDRSDDPRSSLRVGDRYQVLEPIGEGGMGTVYRVRHITLDRLFAMKVLRRDLAADAGLAARFVQEARATAAIKHPCVVAITDFGEMEDGIPYFVMELLEGETLATRIRARGPIHPRTAIQIAKKIAEGLAASHAANVIHRDLKPDNVFLIGKNKGKAAEGEIRVVDFGAAKIIGGSKLTRPGIVFGTPYYMSPEQASGLPIDARADVYSLGVLLYEMITGRVPFEADTYMGVLTKHIFHTPERPTPPEGIQLGDLENVVMRALQKDPDARYASMTELAEALDTAAKDGAVRGPAPSNPSANAAVAQRTVQMRNVATTADRIQSSVNRRLLAETKRKQRMVAIAAVAACTTFGFGAAVLTLGGGVGGGGGNPSSTNSAVSAATQQTGAASRTTTTLPTTTAIAKDPTNTSPSFAAANANANAMVDVGSPAVAEPPSTTFGLGASSTPPPTTTSTSLTPNVGAGARPRITPPIGARTRTTTPTPQPPPASTPPSTAALPTTPAPSPPSTPHQTPTQPANPGQEFQDPWNKH